MRSAASDAYPMMLLRSRDGNKKRNEKPRDPFRQQHAMWLRAYTEAYSVGERFPRVDQLVFDIAFTDLQAIGRYSPQMRSFSASAKAFFAIACPRTLCLGGGFDLDAIVLAMLDAQATTATGTLECQGWLKATPSENARCRLQLHYRLQTRYNTAEASTVLTNARAGEA